jgi:hypothetical protein
MSLTAQQKAYLEYLAKTDMTAAAIFAGISDENSAGVLFQQSYTTPPVADVDWIATGALLHDDLATPILAAGLTNSTIAIPRNVTVTYEAAWDAGVSVMIHGLDQFGVAIEEEIATGQSETKSGSKIFASITSIHCVGTPGAGGATHGATVGFGAKVGLASKLASTIGFKVSVSTTPTSPISDVQIDSTYHAWSSSGTGPDASRSYVVEGRKIA